jgi:hypothetical protein
MDFNELFFPNFITLLKRYESKKKKQEIFKNKDDKGS